MEDQKTSPWTDLWQCKHRNKSLLESWLGLCTYLRYQNDYELQHSTCNEWKRPNYDFHAIIANQLVAIDTLSAGFAVTYTLLARRDALCAVKRWLVGVAGWTLRQASVIKKDRESVTSVALSTLCLDQVALGTRVLTKEVNCQFLSQCIQGKTLLGEGSDLESFSDEILCWILEGWDDYLNCAGVASLILHRIRYVDCFSGLIHNAV